MALNFKINNSRQTETLKLKQVEINFRFLGLTAYSQLRRLLNEKVLLQYQGGAFTRWIIKFIDEYEYVTNG
ncbi:hypothetical protein C1E24_15705 [Pseudoalteromonas phenolica]|uniref:Uncharacterized protein n=1 Tax=Pseudoalteromonas phenolica TaxID=161398 RepID=A0A5R9PZU6_9GAMM|nr:hypothetical protein C1E24_15705 [Pseudoalteromonas phenolica]